MSGQLWVTTPGGLSVATDQILELMDQLGPILVASAHLVADLHGLRNRFSHGSMRRAHDDAEEFLTWSRWLAASLDTYCQQVAQMERVRVELWQRPTNLALSSFLRYLTGRPDAQGGEPGSSIDDVAASLLGSGTPGDVTVQEVSRQGRYAISLTLAERIARIPDTDTPIRIERYLLADGTHHTEVFIAGTNDWSVNSTNSAFDMSSNLALVAGVPAASLIATQRAMAQAGVTSNDKVVFVGHSQGGAVAATLAESGRYNTASFNDRGSPHGNPWGEGVVSRVERGALRRCRTAPGWGEDTDECVRGHYREWGAPRRLGRRTRERWLHRDRRSHRYVGVEKAFRTGQKVPALRAWDGHGLCGWTCLTLFEQWREKQANKPAGEAQDQRSDDTLAEASHMEAKTKPVGNVVHDIEQASVYNKGNQPQSKNVNRESHHSDDVADDCVDYSKHRCDHQIRHHYFHGGGANEDHGLIRVGRQRQARDGPYGNA